MSYLRKTSFVLLAIVALLTAGCIMRNSVEVSGGFFNNELQDSDL